MTAGFAELPEAEATGEIAGIYAEIRHFYGVPYVSSLQRHLATLPGVLEWGWAAVRPAFANGTLQDTARQAAASVDLPPLPRLSRAAIRLLGVRDADVSRIHDICLSFETVAPLNMAMGATLRAFLTGATAGGKSRPRPVWEPPAPLPAPPETLHPDAVDPDTRAVLMQLAAYMDKEPFVPGLYRQLAHWPAYLAHAVTEIVPLLNDPDILAAGEGLRESIYMRSFDLVEQLPPPPPIPADAPVARILASIEAYQVTSPQMICFGKLLREALPA